jgi:ribosomal protein S27AE
MPLMECINCGHVESTHPKFAYCSKCNSTEFRRATDSFSEAIR